MRAQHVLTNHLIEEPCSYLTVTEKEGCSPVKHSDSSQNLDALCQRRTRVGFLIGNEPAKFKELKNEGCDGNFYSIFKT